MIHYDVILIVLVAILLIVLGILVYDWKFKTRAYRITGWTRSSHDAIPIITGKGQLAWKGPPGSSEWQKFSIDHECRGRLKGLTFDAENLVPNSHVDYDSLEVKRMVSDE